MRVDSGSCRSIWSHYKESPKVHEFPLSLSMFRKLLLKPKVPWIDVVTFARTRTIPCGLHNQVSNGTKSVLGLWLMADRRPPEIPIQFLRLRCMAYKPISMRAFSLNIKKNRLTLSGYPTRETFTVKKTKCTHKSFIYFKKSPGITTLLQPTSPVPPMTTSSASV